MRTKIKIVTHPQILVLDIRLALALGFLLCARMKEDKTKEVTLVLCVSCGVCVARGQPQGPRSNPPTFVPTPPHPAPPSLSCAAGGSYCSVPPPRRC